MTRRVAVVTGGSGGIGTAIVDRLSQSGVDVLVVDVAPPNSTAGDPSQRDGVGLLALDVTTPEAAKSIAEHVLEQFGRVDILVNVAGGAGPTRVDGIEDIDVAIWDSVIALNLKSTFLVSRALVPIMRRQQYGRIINFSSVSALGETGPSTTVTARLPYATAKAALLGFTKQLAKDVAPFGITVNALMPGLIMGAVGTRIRDKFEELPEETKEAMRRRWPAGRPGTPEEVAAAVVFLASEDASYISGVALPVDGAFL